MSTRPNGNRGTVRQRLPPLLTHPLCPRRLGIFLHMVRSRYSHLLAPHVFPVWSPAFSRARTPSPDMTASQVRVGLMPCYRCPSGLGSDVLSCLPPLDDVGRPCALRQKAAQAMCSRPDLGYCLACLRRLSDRARRRAS